MSQNILTQGFSSETIRLSSGEILEVSPVPGSLGVPIGSKVTVVFDQEMDLSSINEGTFVLSSSNTSDIFGPSLESDSDFVNKSLVSSNYINSTIDFYKVDSTGELIISEIFDTTGDGALWSTVAVLTPSSLLVPNTEYTVLVSGDEQENSFFSGVQTRSVFDPIKEVYTGSGVFYSDGGYNGSSTKTYVVEILTGGTTGVATYQWWSTSDPLNVKTGITTTGKRILENNISVFFGRDGVFEPGDRWSFLCKPGIRFGSTASWKFNSGSGSIIVPPSSSSTSGILNLPPSVSLDNSSGFEVSRIVPEAGKYGVEIKNEIYDLNQIIITFGGNSNVTEESLTGSISLYSEHSLGDDSTHTSTGALEFEAVLVDNTLTITISPNQLFPNNIIVLTLDRNIENEAGDTLGEDFVSYFSTVYSPLYTSKRRVALDIGPLLRDVSEESIMLAILEASLYADSLNFQGIMTNTAYYQQARREFVSCYAENLLVSGMMSGGSGGRLSKTLGDLQVSRDGTSGISNKQKSLEDCMKYWQIVIESGGAVGPNNSLSPGHSVKGAMANDAIVVHRQWEPMSRVSIPAANSWRQDSMGSSRRGTRTFRGRH